MFRRIRSIRIKALILVSLVAAAALVMAWRLGRSKTA